MLLLLPQDFLRNKLKAAQYKPMFINFSAHTNTTSVQDLVMSGLDKRKKGLWKRKFYVFVIFYLVFFVYFYLFDCVAFDIDKWQMRDGRRVLL